MATIRKTGENSYQISVYSEMGADGKYKRKFMHYSPKEKAPTKIQKELQTVANEFENRVKKGLIYSGDSTSFSDTAALWIRDYVTDNASQKTKEDYERMLAGRIAPAIGRLPMGKITPLHINDIYRTMINDGLSVSTVKRYHCVVSGVFKFAYKSGLIESNPCDRVTLPRTTSRYKYHIWDEAQIDAFFKALKKQYSTHVSERHRADSSGNVYSVSPYDVDRHISSMFYALYHLCIFSSARRGEIAPLTWEDIDFTKKELSITKAVTHTKAEGYVIKGPKTPSGYRRVTLPDRCLAALKEWKKDQIRLSFELGTAWKGYTGREYDQNFIFIQKDSGKMIHLDTIGSKFHDIVRIYNESCEDPADRLPEIRLHDLRHTGASLLIANNVDIVTVSHRLGHAKPSTTMDIYSHALPLKDQMASDVLDSLIKSGS